MAFFDQPVEVVSFSMALLILLLKSYEEVEGLSFPMAVVTDDSNDDMNDVIVGGEGVLASISATTLHTYRLCHLFCFFNEDLGY
jgi:hypothetical protein